LLNTACLDYSSITMLSDLVQSSPNTINMTKIWAFVIGKRKYEL